MQEKQLYTFALYLALIFSAFVVSVGGLVHFAGLGFLIGALTPLLVMSALSWGLYAFVRASYNARGRMPAHWYRVWGRRVLFCNGRRNALGDTICRVRPVGILSLAMGVRQAQRQQDRDFEAAFQLNLGVLHARQGKLTEALVAYAEVQRHFELLADGRGLGDVLTNVGQAQAHLGRLEAAFESGERALKVHQETGSTLWRAGALSCLGYVGFRRGELAEALVHL